MIVFLPTDLGISDQALGQITAQLANATNATPIVDAIARCTQLVRDYTLRYVIENERQYRLIRALVLFDLYSNPALGVMPPNVATMQKAAMQELVDIRDGKFIDLALAVPADPADGDAPADFGSQRHVSFRRGSGEINWD
jgi:hypothetical protein